MSAPPGVPVTTGPNLRANGEMQDRAEFLSARVLTREAAKVCDSLNITLGGGRLRTLVTRFIESGRSDLDFRTWFIGYADPTGERATANVVKERGF